MHIDPSILISLVRRLLRLFAMYVRMYSLSMELTSTSLPCQLNL